MEVLADYTDRHGREHTVVLIREAGGSLVLDTAGQRQPRVVAELEAGEDVEQALCLLWGEGAYIDRAQAAEDDEPLCRELGDDELREALAAERGLAA